MYCRKCGYVLDGLSENCCPECGQVFHPDVPRTYLTSILPWWRVLAGRFAKIPLAVVALVVLVMMLSLFITIRTEMVWIDAMTGSCKYQTRWIFGIASTPRIEWSDLEKWRLRREGRVRNIYWQPVITKPKNWLGFQGTSYYMSQPPIYGLRNELMKIYVAISTDEQKAQFIHTMRYGTKEQQKLAVEDASNMLLDWFEAPTARQAIDDD